MLIVAVAVVPVQYIPQIMGLLLWHREEVEQQIILSNQEILLLLAVVAGLVREGAMEEEVLLAGQLEWQGILPGILIIRLEREETAVLQEEGRALVVAVAESLAAELVEYSGIQQVYHI